MRTRIRLSRSTAFGLCAALAIVFAVPAIANVDGAIFTTTSDGTTVNGNIYSSKADVYLNGGPQNEHANGLPDGTYYFQVTDPSGSVLLSIDAIGCRELQVTNGRVSGATGTCPHAPGTTDTANSSTPVQLIPFNDTPNNGDEYKVWLTPTGSYSLTSCGTGGHRGKDAFGFCDSDSKTD